MITWFKNWRAKRLQAKIAKEFNRKDFILGISDVAEADNKIPMKEILNDDSGVLSIRKCYPDGHGDIGPGDDNPDNWKN